MAYKLSNMFTVENINRSKLQLLYIKYKIYLVITNRLVTPICISLVLEQLRAKHGKIRSVRDF